METTSIRRESRPYILAQELEHALTRVNLYDATSHNIPESIRHYKHSSFLQSGIQDSTFNAKVVCVLNLVISVAIPYICNVSGTMRELWQSKIDLKLAGSLEIIHNDAV